jgi:hypothetical protein
MATFSYPTSYLIRSSSNRDNHNRDQNKQKLNNIRINGTSSRPSNTKADHILSQTAGVATTFNSITSVAGNGYITTEELRQNIPTKKQSVDTHRQGLIIEGGVGYRQTVVIRSYEVGPDKTATIESILNLLQGIKMNLLNYPFLITHAQIYERSPLRKEKKKKRFTDYILKCMFWFH